MLVLQLFRLALSDDSVTRELVAVRLKLGNSQEAIQHW